MSIKASVQGFLAPAPAGQEVEVGATESFPHTFVCPLEFKLYDLQVNGTSKKAACPSNSPYIIAADEDFILSVIVEFTPSPLAQTLMCLGVPVTITFSLEGYGSRTAELDLDYSFKTYAGEYKYLVQLQTKAIDTNPIMTPGLYEIAAVAEIGGKIGNCPAPIWGHGYVEEALLEVYAAGEDA
jgi:hypothetical protein